MANVNRRALSISLTSLLCLSMIMTVLPAGTSAIVIPASTTFFTEDVEEATFEEWDARWSKTDMNPNASLDYWCRSGHENYAGTHAAYCARSGYNSHYYDTDAGEHPLNYNILGAATGTPAANLVQRYDTHMDAIMRKYVSGAGYYSTITLSFWFYSDTGLSNAKQPGTGALVGYDFLNVVYYTGTNNSLTKHIAWTDTQQQAFAKSWIPMSVMIPNNATWVGFEFVSGTVPPEGGDAADAFISDNVRTNPTGTTGMKEGVYNDNISCIGTDPVTSLPVETSVSALPAYQTSLSFNVTFVDNDPLGLNLEWTYLYYRFNGTGDWIKYTTAEKPFGAFVASPISFVATQDGLYEFFTQGKSYNGTLEDMRNAADSSTMVDTGEPITTIAFIGTQREGGFVGAAAFTLTSTDNVSGIEQTQYRIDGGEMKTYNGSVGLATTGTHMVEYRSIDKAGNEEELKSATMIITAGSPGIVFLERDMTYPSGNLTLNFTLADVEAIKKLEYSLDGGPFQELAVNATSLSFTNLSLGTHNVTVRATDIDGRTVQDMVEFSVGGGDKVSMGSIMDDPIMLGGLTVCGLAAVIGGSWLVKRKRG